ncbi:MAG: hypothetical protein GX437_03445 [Sphingobacteriales bacterium]|nr:hypothetical protein [Sphingobacteriales bacterium]
MKKMIALLCLVLAFYFNKAQDIQQNEPFIRWKQIKTDHYKIIYPEELSAEARRVANTLEYVREPLQKTLKPRKFGKWTLMLTNRGAMANGYVGLAPRRSEWYSAPPQGSLVGTGEWYRLLSVHEGRHMVQYDKFNHGLTRIASLFFGQTGVNALSVISVPMWFWEGDAVGTETSLTATGRGRIPDFDLHVRALLLAGKRYSYYKAYMLSYKDYYPNWYTLGYLMNCYVRRHNPPDTWDKIHNRVSWFSVSPFRFSRMMKKYTGLNARKTYNAAMDELDSIYRWQVSGLQFTESKIINKRNNKIWTNFENPVYSADGKIIALQYGLADDIHLVSVNPEDGSVKKIKQLPVYEKPSIAGDYICYNEYCYDKRYLNQNYSDIVLFNFKTGQTRYLTTKGRFFVPEISPDFTKIVAVEFTTDRRCNLVIFDFKTGAILERIPEKDNAFIQTPSWSEDGKKLVFTRQKFNGKSLVILDLETKAYQVVIPETWENIANPVFYRNYIIYESPYSGVDNLYAIDIQTGKRYQITNCMLAGVNASLSDDESKMLFLEYSEYGYNIAEIAVNPATWKPIEDVQVRETRYFEPMIEQEQGRNIFEGETGIPETVYPETDYHQSAHLLNVHSWTFLPSVKSGSFSLTSNDLLNTTGINLFANYNRDKTWSTGFSLSYNRFYPLFTLSAERNRRNSNGNLWNEKDLTAGVDIPLFNNRGAWQRFAMLSLSSGVRQVDGRTDVDSFDAFNGRFIPLNASFQISNTKSSAQRDVDSRWSQSLTIHYSRSLFSDQLVGNIFSLQSAFNFPGMAKSHVITIEADFEKHHHETYWFASNVNFVRGYTYERQDNFRRFSVNYHFPVLYPDLPIGALFYLKRVRSAVFYDHGAGSFQGNSTLYRSAGFDINFDFNILNLPFEFNAGIRVPYLFDENQWTLRLLFLGMEL